jgi:hypothetical protein
MPSAKRVGHPSALALLLVPDQALACAVCGFGDDPTLSWYLISTAFLSLIPLAAMGGIIYFLVRRSRQQ